MLHVEREGKTALSQRTIVRVDLNDQVYDSLKERLLTPRRLMEGTLEPVEEEEIRDARSYMLANKEFHEYQIDLASNSLISEMYRRLCIHQLMERTILVLGVSAAGDSTPEHTRIVEAFEAGDLQAARAALRSNVETGKRIAREAIERADGTL